MEGISSDCLFKVIDSKLGVIHLTQCLSPDVQLKLYSDIKNQSATSQTHQARNPNSNFSKLIKISAQYQAKKITPLYHLLAKEAMNKAAEACTQIPADCTINYITSFLYPVPDGKLTEHCDRQDGWVLIFSLGCIAKFYIRTVNLPKPIVIDFCSGDALIFDSSAKANVRHAILEIVPNSAPQHLPDALQNCRMMLQYRQLPVGVTQKAKDHVVFTVKEALVIHAALHSQVAAITLRKVVCPIQTLSDGTRTAPIHGIVCTQQSPSDQSQWAKYARDGHKITWIKSPGHWGRIIDGKIGNKGTAITGFAPDYHKGSHNIQTTKKFKVSEDESTSIVSSTLQSDYSSEEDTQTIVPDSGRTFICLAEMDIKKKKLNITATDLSDFFSKILMNFGQNMSQIGKRIEYEDPDFGEFIIPTTIEEIPTKTRIRIVSSSN